VLAAVAVGTAVLGIRSTTTTAARILILCAVAGLLLLVAAGHAGEVSGRWHDLATVSLELHVFAAALWTGGLGAIVTLLSRDRVLLARALPSYSPLASGCLAVVAVSGLLNAAIALSTKPGSSLPSELLHTDYGRLVILKAVCLCSLAGIGGHIRYRLLPRILLAHRASVVVWACWELGVMGTAFGLAAVLGRSAA
jgi:putative copper resistance protein D